MQILVVYALQDFKTGVKESSFSIAAIFSFATSVSDRFLLFPFIPNWPKARSFSRCLASALKSRAFTIKSGSMSTIILSKHQKLSLSIPLPAGQYAIGSSMAASSSGHAIPSQLIIASAYFMHTCRYDVSGVHA